MKQSTTEWDPDWEFEDMDDKIDMVDYCNALKETARQKESDNTEALTKQQLLSRIRRLEAENYILKQRLSQDDWK